MEKIVILEKCQELPESTQKDSSEPCDHEFGR
jgi:hypothetical protein